MMNNPRSNESRINKSVSFSKDDAFEIRLLEHANKHNKFFSAYIKRLIQRDMEIGAVMMYPTSAPPPPPPIPTPEAPKEIKSISKGALSSFGIKREST